MLGCVFFWKIQIRISESKNGFPNQIQIRIFEIHNLSVFLGKDRKKVFLTSGFSKK